MDMGGWMNGHVSSDCAQRCDEKKMCKSTQQLNVNRNWCLSLCVYYIMIVYIVLENKLLLYWNEQDVAKREHIYVLFIIYKVIQIRNQ